MSSSSTLQQHHPIQHQHEVASTTLSPSLLQSAIHSSNNHQITTTQISYTSAFKSFSNQKKISSSSSSTTSSDSTNNHHSEKVNTNNNNNNITNNKTDVKYYSNQNLLKSMTVSLILNYKLCSKDFKYDQNVEERKKIALTEPSIGIHNNNKDNEEGNLILFVDTVLQERYCVKDLLGQGTFGQVVRCEDLITKQHVAVKVIKNRPEYLKQSMIEINILDELQEIDKEDKHHIIKKITHFYFENHLCIVSELLSINLFELIKQNRFRGLSLNVISVFLSQILDAICLLQDANIIHCDLKPENILLTDLSHPKNLVKLIDFGSAYHDDHNNTNNFPFYIQSRFYRAPEVLFGYKYCKAIDLWSLGCICAELFLGLPLLPGVSQYNQICRMIEMFGLPPNHVIEYSKFGYKYFRVKQQQQSTNGNIIYELKTEKQYLSENPTQSPVEWKRYFNYTKLPDLIKHYGDVSKLDEKEIRTRYSFIDFLNGLLQIDPAKRWTADQAILHPFVTGQEFKEPFQPPPTKHSIAIQTFYQKVLNDYQVHRQKQLWVQQSNNNGISGQKGVLNQQHLNQQSFLSYGLSPIGNNFAPHLGVSPGTNSFNGNHNSYIMNNGSLSSNNSSSLLTTTLNNSFDQSTMTSNISTNSSATGIPISSKSNNHTKQTNNNQNNNMNGNHNNNLNGSLGSSFGSYLDPYGSSWGSMNNQSPNLNNNYLMNSYGTNNNNLYYQQTPPTGNNLYGISPQIPLGGSVSGSGTVLGSTPSTMGTPTNNNGYFSTTPNGSSGGGYNNRRRNSKFSTSPYNNNNTSYLSPNVNGIQDGMSNLSLSGNKDNNRSNNNRNNVGSYSNNSHAGGGRNRSNSKQYNNNNSPQVNSGTPISKPPKHPSSKTNSGNKNNINSRKPNNNFGYNNNVTGGIHSTSTSFTENSEESDDWNPFHMEDDNASSTGSFNPYYSGKRNNHHHNNHNNNRNNDSEIPIQGSSLGSEGFYGSSPHQNNYYNNNGHHQNQGSFDEMNGGSGGLTSSSYHNNNKQTSKSFGHSNNNYYHGNNNNKQKNNNNQYGNNNNTQKKKNY
ncbi:hypothetical protein ABK040_003245 [Willaertia magna]